MTRRALVHRISANAPDDVSGIAAAIASKQIDPGAVIAVLAKTEGNGLVNDFSRGHATLALSLLFQRHLPAQQAAQICLVMSGGTEGAMTPHWLVFERRDGEKAAKPALAIGRAHTAASHSSISADCSRSIRWRPACAPPWRMPGSIVRPTSTSFR
jgi:cyanuric acid amidohydrolase